MSSYSFLPHALVRGEWKPFADANVSIATHSLHYGNAAFGGMRGIVDPAKHTVKLFRLADHAKRLAQSASYLGMTVTPEWLIEQFLELIARNKPEQDFYVRPLVYTSRLGLSPEISHLPEDHDLILYGCLLGDYFTHDASVCFSSWMRQSDASFPLRGKISAAYITSALAKTEAKERGFDDGILMNSAGKVCEGTGMNIFVVRDGIIYTPWVDQDILEWITRKSVIEMARHLGYTVVERPIDKTELFIADELFFTGTAARIAPIGKIEHHHTPKNRPITERLRSLYGDILAGKNEVFGKWVTEVKM